MPIMAKKPSPAAKKPTYHLTHEQQRYLEMARSLWRAARGLAKADAERKKQEALGWALLVARLEAEKGCLEGDDLSACLLRAAQVLKDEARKV